jgi:5-methylcytosine-specific restriction endonuclease McrA
MSRRVTWARASGALRELKPAAKGRLKHLRRFEKLPIVKGRCRLCGDKRPPSRRGYCSDECQNGYLMATDLGYVRFRIHERDKGVCAECGLDCDDHERRVWGYSTMAKVPPKGSPAERALRTPHELRVTAIAMLKKNGFAGLTPSSAKTLWNADHIVPVVDGGSFLMDNLQTLCLTCHDRKSTTEATLRARRGKLLGRKWERDASASGRTRRKRPNDRRPGPTEELTPPKLDPRRRSFLRKGPTLEKKEEASKTH